MAPRFGLLIGLLVFAPLCGCGRAIKTSDRNIEQIQYEQLRELLREPPEENRGPLGWLVKADPGQQGPVLVDVRAPEKYRENHLPNAVNITLPEMVRDDPRLRGDGQIIVYASGWDDPLSAAGAKKLLALGYSKVFEFRGGMELWEGSDEAGTTGQ